MLKTAFWSTEYGEKKNAKEGGYTTNGANGVNLEHNVLQKRACPGLKE